MFNPDLKKLLKNTSSRYSLVVAVAKRARQIRQDAIDKEEILDRKVVSMAMDELYDGKYIVEEPESIKAKNND